MPVAANTTTLKVSGTAVPVTNEACTSLGGGVYQVTSTTRRIWDTSAAITIKDGASTVASTLWSFDYLFGRVTFSGYTPTGAVTVSGSYLPVAAVAEAKSVSLTFGPELLERTSFDSAGVKTKLGGLVDGSGSFEFLSLLTDDLDPVTVGAQSLHTRWTAGEVMVLEVKLGAYFFRAWIILESLEEGSEVAGLVEGSANFQLAPQRAGAVLAFGT